MPRPLLLSLACWTLFTGCHGTLKDGVFTKDGVRYRVGEVTAGWKQVSLPENDLAFVSTNSPHSLAINATCENFEDAPLDVLTGHLLMGFTDRKVLAQRTGPLDVRDAREAR